MTLQATRTNLFPSQYSIPIVLHLGNNGSTIILTFIFRINFAVLILVGHLDAALVQILPDERSRLRNHWFDEAHQIILGHLLSPCQHCRSLVHCVRNVSHISRFLLVEESGTLQPTEGS